MAVYLGTGYKGEKNGKKTLNIYIYILKFLSSTFRCRVENCHLPSAIIVPSQTILNRLTIPTGKRDHFLKIVDPLTFNVKKSPFFRKKIYECLHISEKSRNFVP